MEQGCPPVYTRGLWQQLSTYVDYKMLLNVFKEIGAYITVHWSGGRAD